jgi:threonine/homoserine/homoserine lactone efflux protein
MALTSLSVYSPNQEMQNIMLVSLVFALVNLPSVSIWALIGKQMQRWLGSNRRLRIFNIAMALALVVSLIPAL